MPTLSLCMIVRDEAKLLPEFLKSVEGLCDQLVVVDTGSVDETVPLLTAAGAEVHHFPWQDDFALARNESLAQARSDWILVLDADEFPQPGFREEIRDLVANDRIGAANISRHDEQRNGIVRVGRPLRLFRNIGSPRYRYRIHEEIASDVMAMLEATGREAVQMRTPVRHVGYVHEQLLEKSKFERDERLLKLAVAEGPEDLYSRYKLLEQYCFWGRQMDMAAVAADCRALIERGVAIKPPYIAGSLVEMIRLALFPDGTESALTFLKGMAYCAEHTGHYHAAIATQYEQKKQLEQAFFHFTRALELAGGDPAMRLIQTRALTGLVRLSMLIGDWQSAREFTEAAAGISPDDPEIRLAREYLARQATTGA